MSCECLRIVANPLRIFKKRPPSCYCQADYSLLSIMAYQETVCNGCNIKKMLNSSSQKKIVLKKGAALQQGTHTDHNTLEINNGWGSILTNPNLKHADPGAYAQCKCLSAAFLEAPHPILSFKSALFVSALPSKNFKPVDFSIFERLTWYLQ